MSQDTAVSHDELLALVQTILLKGGLSLPHAAAAHDRALPPFGGHKGSALSTMSELPGGILINDLTSQGPAELDAGSEATGIAIPAETNGLLRQMLTRPEFARPG